MFEENKEICRRLVEQGYGKGNLKAVEETVSQKCRLHDPAFPDLQAGADNLERHIERLRAAFPNLTWTCDDLIAERDEVVIHWTCRGTQRGEFFNHAPTNRTAIVTGTSIFRLNHGKIVEMWSDWNLQSLLDQLGLGMTEAEGNKALVSRFLEEVWNRRRPELIEQVLTANCMRTSPTGVVRGPAGYRQEFDTLISAMPDFHLNIEEMACEGERVTVRFTASGTQQGRLLDLPATGRHVTLPGITLFRVVGGKIVDQHVQYDQLGLIQQLGATTQEAARAAKRPH